MAATRSRTAARVRPARPRELAATARLHRRTLPRGFFARLGDRFVRRYHATFAASPEAVVLVAASEDGRRPTGFLAGTLANATHYRWVLRRRGAMLALSGLLALLRRPAMAREFLRTRFGRYLRAVRRQLGRRLAPVTAAGDTAGPRPDAPSSDADEPETVAVLTHVAVAPDAQGEGVGRDLVDEFVHRARDAGADEVRLITDAGGGAARFYRRLGWRSRGRRRAADGSEVEEFQLPL